MKVLHLITGLDLGGAERQLAALVGNTAASSDIQYFVVSLKDEGILGKTLKEQGTPVYCLNLHQSFKGIWKFWKILRTLKPDVLQTWLYHADLLGLILGKLARIKNIVWNIRCSNMELAHYSRLTSLVVKSAVFFSSFPQAVVTNSQAGQDFHIHLGYKPRKWIKIPNGIDTNFFRPDYIAKQRMRQELGIPEDSLVIGMIARIDPMKDFTTFLKAVSHLSTEYKNLYCVVAGKDTELASWADVPARLIRLGIVKNMPNLLNSLDIMVLSSLFGEGFPNVVGEAMACGVPTIATDVGDAAALIQDSSRIIPPQKQEDLIIALKKLLKLSSDERKDIGEQSRERILRSYSLSRMRQNYENFYKSLP